MFSHSYYVPLFLVANSYSYTLTTGNISHCSCFKGERGREGREKEREGEERGVRESERVAEEERQKGAESDMVKNISISLALKHMRERAMLQR